MRIHATKLIAIIGALGCLTSLAAAQTDGTSAPAPTEAASPAAPTEGAPAAAPTEGVAAPTDDASAAAGGTVLAGPTAELDARLMALEVYLKEQQWRSRLYFGGWVSVMSLLTVGQAAQAALEDDKAARASSITGSCFSGLGLALVLIAPSPGRYGYRKFKKMPTGTPEERNFKQIQGEEWLRGEAAAVRRTHAWFTHVLGATLGVGGFLGLYLGYDDNFENALRTGLGTIVVTELRVWTRTKRAIRKFDEYQATTPAQVFITPLFAPGAQGLAAAGVF
jgi:hypothetical protein